MSTFSELVGDAYFWLGTKPTNQAFLPAQIKRLVNMANAAFWRDCLESFPDALAVPVTLTADATDTGAYIFASQSPALGAIAKLVEVRLTNNQGILLDEVPFSERYRCGGYTYSLLGVDSGITLYAGQNITASSPLYLAYVPAVETLSDDGDSPDWCPAEFHDVVSLKAARLAVGSGNEQTMSPLLLDTLLDREGQARFAFGQRSLTPTFARSQGV